MVANRTDTDKGDIGLRCFFGDGAINAMVTPQVTISGAVSK
ncbi:hypothetical protein L327_0124130 [Yersinia pestis S3]|nr:hypothetical protein L327_0124130 [Yersinia pestis S3]